MRTKRDLYDVLGVPRTASADEIRRAHRRLVRELHPDVNKAPDAAERFAEVQEAYEILSDQEKRKQYDQFGFAAFDAEATQSSHRGRSGGTYTWSSVGGPGFGGATEGFDAEDISSIFEEFFGARRSGFGGEGFHERVRARPQRGRDLRVQTTVSFYTAAHGGVESLSLKRGGAQQTIEVKIPRGIADGATLRIAGKGEPGRNGGPPGDLLLTVRVAPHPLFRRDGLDVSLDLPLTIAEAALGATVSVPTPLGERVELKVPAGTSSGAKLRLRGKGLEDAQGRRGDLYAVVKIVAPKQLDEEDRQALERLGRKLPNPRTGAGWA